MMRSAPGATCAIATACYAADMDEMTAEELLNLLLERADSEIKRQGTLRSDGYGSAVNVQLYNGQAFRIEIQDLN